MGRNQLSYDECRDVGNRVYEALTEEEKARLVEAMREAASSNEGDHSDDWLCALGNAGVTVPNRAGEPVTETQQRIVCADLERARLQPQTDGIDWRRLLQGAFGSASSDRLLRLYGDALESDEQDG